MSEHKDDLQDFGRTRLETLTDGIFAIAMTILVLTINPPRFPDSASNQEIIQRLGRFLPNLMAYVASFITLGMYWVTHHTAFRFLTRTDRVILWLNIYFLLMVSFVPFTTAMYAGDADNVLLNDIFGCNLVVVGLLNYALWAYALKRNYVLEEISHETRLFATQRILTPPIIAAVAMGAAMLTPKFAEMIYLLMVPVFMVTIKRIGTKKTLKSSSESG